MVSVQFEILYDSYFMFGRLIAHLFDEIYFSLTYLSA